MAAVTVRALGTRMEVFAENSNLNSTPVCAAYGEGLPSLISWDRGFESHLRDVRSSVVFVV